LGDSALGEVVFLGEPSLGEAVDLIVEIDLDIAPGGGGEFARAVVGGFEGCGHGRPRVRGSDFSVQSSQPKCGIVSFVH
jgi:hypothetical protein